MTADDEIPLPPEPPADPSERPPFVDDEWEDPRIAQAEAERDSPYFDGDEADRMAEREYDRFWERRE